jgi:hypothetical protein
MNNPKKIDERRFIDARELGEAITDVMEYLSIYLGRGPKDATPVTYVKTFANNDEDQDRSHVRPYAYIVRLWEDTLTDGSKVYEVHIL